MQVCLYDGALTRKYANTKLSRYYREVGVTVTIATVNIPFEHSVPPLKNFKIIVTKFQSNFSNFISRRTN